MMKKVFISILMITAALTSCEDRAVQEIDVPASGAQIKFYNFSVNAPIVNFYANDTKVTAATSTTGSESGTSGVAYGAVGPAVNYALINPGTYAFKGVTPSTAAVDPNTVVSSLSSMVENGKYYSYYMSGIYNTGTKTSDAFIVEDKLPAVDSTVAYVRFVHAISNANAMDFTAKNTTTNEVTVLGAGIAYKSASPFVKLPQGIYDLAGKYAGASTNAVSRTAVSFVKGKVYTISGRGDITVTSTTATNRPILDNTANR